MSSYIRIKEREKIYVRCKKCGDSFILDHGGKSHRRPCRYHVYKAGICIDCGQIQGRGGRNCYHINNLSLCCFPCCTIC